MHKWAKEILECVKEKAKAIGIDNFEGQNLDDLKDWTEIVKNIARFDKDYRIVEAMDKLQNDDEIMEMVEQYGDYPSRHYYDRYRYANGRFAPKGRGTRTTGRRGYDEPPYWHMTPEMYYEWADMPEEERMRDLDRLRFGRMYYSDPRRGSQMPSDGRSVEDMGMKSESRYDRARRSYSETKDMHKANTKEDNDANMRGLESGLAVIDEDLKEIMPGLSASEKTMMKTKMTNWVQRI